MILGRLLELVVEKIRTFSQYTTVYNNCSYLTSILDFLRIAGNSLSHVHISYANNEENVRLKEHTF